MNNQEIIDKQLYKKSEVIEGVRYVRWLICLEYAEETKEQERAKLTEEFKNMEEAKNKMENELINNKINNIFDSFNLEFQKIYKKVALEGNPMITLGINDEFVATNEYWDLIKKYKEKINKLIWTTN